MNPITEFPLTQIYQVNFFLRQFTFQARIFQLAKESMDEVRCLEPDVSVPLTRNLDAASPRPGLVEFRESAPEFALYLIKSPPTLNNPPQLAPLGPAL